MTFEGCFINFRRLTFEQVTMATAAHRLRRRAFGRNAIHRGAMRADDVTCVRHGTDHCSQSSSRLLAMACRSRPRVDSGNDASRAPITQFRHCEQDIHRHRICRLGETTRAILYLWGCVVALTKINAGVFSWTRNSRSEDQMKRHNLKIAIVPDTGFNSEVARQSSRRLCPASSCQRNHGRPALPRTTTG